MCVNRSNSINRFRLYSPIHHLRLIHAKLGTRQIIYRSLDLAAGVLSQHNLYGARRNTVRNTRDNFRPWSLDADQGHREMTVTWARKLVITRDITAGIPGIGILSFNHCDS